MTHGFDFDPSPYWIDGYGNTGMKNLGKTLKNSKAPTMIAYNLDLKEEADYE